MGDRGPTGHGGIHGTCRLFISVRKVHEEKSDEKGGGERHYGLPQQKERKSLSKQRRTCSASSMYMKEGRTKLTSARRGPVSEGPVSEGPVSGGTKRTMGEGLVFAWRGSAEGEGTTDRTEGGGLVFARRGVGLTVAQRGPMSGRPVSGGTTERTVGDGLSVVQRIPMSGEGLAFACPVSGGTTAGGAVVGAAEHTASRVRRIR